MSARTFDAVIRVSRRNGRKGDAFMSPAEQREAIQRHAAANGVRIAKWWDESDSVSGGSVDREGLQAAIGRAVSGEVDGIYVAKVDRFARTVQGGLSAINTLEDAGRELWSAREGAIVGDESNATDKMIRTLFLMLAQWQRDTLTEGWEAVRHRHIANGIYTTEPYGYRKDEDTRKLVAHPKEGSWVPRIFERRAKGESWQGIAEWLNSQDAPTRNGGRWAYTSVRNVVTSRVYLGEITSGDIVNTSAHDSLVDVDLWDRANRLAKTPKRRDAEQYLLSGIIRCAGCGVRMFGMTDRKTNAAGEVVTYRYYRCRARHSVGRCAAPAKVRAELVDEIAERTFVERFLSRRVAVASVATDELDRATAALARAEADLRDFVTSDAVDEMRRTLGSEIADDAIRARTARVAEAREAVADARNAAHGIHLPVDLDEMWPTLNVEDKRGPLSDGLALVAVVAGRGNIADRVRVWTLNDQHIPDALPVPGNFQLRAIDIAA